MATITEEQLADARARYQTDDMRETAAAIALALAGGKTVEYEWQPGDMTRYAFVLTLLDRDGDATYSPGEARIQESYWRGQVVCALVNFGVVFTFTFDGEIRYDYVDEHTNGRVALGSCIAVEQFLNAISAAARGEYRASS